MEAIPKISIQFIYIVFTFCVYGFHIAFKTFSDIVNSSEIQKIQGFSYLLIEYYHFSKLYYNYTTYTSSETQEFMNPPSLSNQIFIDSQNKLMRFAYPYEIFRSTLLNGLSNSFSQFFDKFLTMFSKLTKPLKDNSIEMISQILSEEHQPKKKKETRLIVKLSKARANLAILDHLRFVLLDDFLSSQMGIEHTIQSLEPLAIKYKRSNLSEDSEFEWYSKQLAMLNRFSNVFSNRGTSLLTNASRDSKSLRVIKSTGEHLLGTIRHELQLQFDQKYKRRKRKLHPEKGPTPIVYSNPDFHEKCLVDKDVVRLKRCFLLLVTAFPFLAQSIHPRFDILQGLDEYRTYSTAISRRYQFSEDISTYVDLHSPRNQRGKLLLGLKYLCYLLPGFDLTIDWKMQFSDQLRALDNWMS